MMGKYYEAENVRKTIIWYYEIRRLVQSSSLRFLLFSFFFLVARGVLILI